MWHLSLLILAIRVSFILLTSCFHHTILQLQNLQPHFLSWLLFLELRATLEDLLRLSFHYTGCIIIALYSPPDFCFPQSLLVNLTLFLCLCPLYLAFMIQDLSILSYFLILKIPYILKWLSPLMAGKHLMYFL